MDNLKVTNQAQLGAVVQNRSQAGTAAGAAQQNVGSVENASQNNSQSEAQILDTSFLQNAVPRAQVDSMISKGQSLMGTNKFDEAASFFRKAADLDPSDRTAHHYAEMAHYKAGLTKFVTSSDAGQEAGNTLQE